MSLSFTKEKLFSDFKCHYLHIMKSCVGRLRDSTKVKIFVTQISQKLVIPLPERKIVPSKNSKKTFYPSTWEKNLFPLPLPVNMYVHIDLSK